MMSSYSRQKTLSRWNPGGWRTIWIWMTLEARGCHTQVILSCWRVLSLLSSSVFKVTQSLGPCSWLRLRMEVRSCVLRQWQFTKTHAQDFLKPVLVLCDIPPGPPLREPELLSVMWRNTARQRHLLMWEKLVLIYTQYHKGQQQSGAYKDNIRFLPKAIGDLLLVYIAYVLPLRQMFLRQQTPGALISPYLWAKLDGTVWADGDGFRLFAQGMYSCKDSTVPKCMVAPGSRINYQREVLYQGSGQLWSRRVYRRQYWGWIRSSRLGRTK